MIRILAALAALFVVTGFAGAAAAQDCEFGVGDYVGVTWAGDPDQPAMVRAVSPGDPRCYYDVRLLVVPSRSILYLVTLSDDELEPFTGTLPYDKPYGCPYAVGDAADYAVDPYAPAYAPALITSLNEDCDVELVYQDETGADVPKAVGQSLIETYLRPAELARKSAETLAVEAAEAEAAERQAEADRASAMTCKLKGAETAEAIAGGDPDAAVKRAVFADFNARVAGLTTLYIRFTSIRPGRAFTVADPSTFLTQNDDAIVGETANPYRVELEACGEYPDKPAETLTTRIDYICYTSLFEDYKCVR